MSNPRVTTKRCRICQQYKPFSEFYVNKNGTYGLDARCKPCAREYSRTYRKMPDALRRDAERKRQWAVTGRERARKWVQRAVALGNLTRQPCVDCGTPNADASLQSFDIPPQIVWLCVTCRGARKRARQEG